MKRVVLAALLGLEAVYGTALVTSHGVVKAHTEVFGDSSIDPQTAKLTSHLQMDDTIESIHGSVDVDIMALKSDNHTRDEHMVEALQSKKFPVATYRFTSIKKQTHGYLIQGVLHFHGVDRPLSLQAKIENGQDSVHILAKGHIKLSQYKVKPIKLLFLEVRDRIDLKTDVVFKKR